MQVRLYADSLGLPRQNVVDNENRYFSLLIKYLENKTGSRIEAVDHSRSDTTINYLYSWFVEDNRYFGNNIDVIVLQEGIVDCAPRPIPRKIRNVVSKLPGFLRKIIIKFLHNNRAKLQKIGLKYYLTKPDEFYQVYMKFLKLASEISKRVYVFNIAPTNDEIEAHSPGLKQSINNYNKIIAQCIEETKKDNIYLIDVFKIISERASALDEYVIKEDGHHITSLSHKLYAEKIIEVEERF